MDAKSALLTRKRVLPNMRENETVLGQSIISNAIYWKGVAVLIIAIIFLLIAWQLAIFLALVATVALLFAHLRKMYLLLIVTDQRVLVRSGVLLADTIQLQYPKIESVELQTTLAGQMFGYSTLMVSGTGSRLAFLPFVANPLRLQTIINEMLQQRDLTSQGAMLHQARVQAEAIAEALEEQKDSQDKLII